MRALCGAIITAGALLGLGLFCIGMGLRYGGYSQRPDDHVPAYVAFRDLDSPSALILVLLCISLVVGLGVAFLGLAYHHYRRHHEFLHSQVNGAPQHTREHVSV
jgi:hypothetical protein